MSEIVFAIPGDLSLPTGGYAYDRRLLREWCEMGVAARHLPLSGGFPNPSEADLAETGRAILSQPRDGALLIDGLAYGAFPEGIAAGLTGRVVALVHHPLGLETGLSPQQAAEFVRRETAALRYASAVVVTSETTRRLLVDDFAVPAEKITVAEPGAMIGFLGARVYEALYGRSFPEGVQTAENLFEHGLIDAILPAEALAEVADRALTVLSGPREDLPDVPELPKEPLADLPAWESITRSRREDRPGVRALLRRGPALQARAM